MTYQHVIIIVSALGGLIGGMGMGGGTLLIPLLTLCAGVEQHLAQAINLIAFVPMSIIALSIHRQNGYVAVGTAVPIALIALIGAAAGSIATVYASGRILKICFGVFLTALGVGIAIKNTVQVVKKFKKNKQAKKPQYKTER
ncbi:MAG: TSUP family transporter [Clostridiales bacterium]|nr:TSUP family transporter [Clostridiales bacterium]